MKAKYLKTLLKHPNDRSALEHLELLVFFNSLNIRDFLKWINFEYKLHGV